MKVRELVARLAKADPEDIVAIDRDSRCLLLLNRRPGMCQVFEEHEERVELTERDKEFLCSLRVRF
jgi:hypothetical protein